jgi:tetratricopeptide (TPR) repeat protein
MKTHLDYNKIAKKILKNNKTNIHKNLCFNLLCKSLEIEPDFFGTYHLLGTYYSDLNDCINAEICYKKSIKLNENNTASYFNLITLYHNQEQIDKAIEIGNKLINLKHFNFDYFYTQLGMMYLLNGDFKNGWKYYEFTKPKENLNDILNFKGEVIITAEQGLGDNILFCRFGKLLKDKGITVSYAVSSKLINLIESSKIYYKVYDIERLEKTSSKKYIPLFNLLSLFNVNLIDYKIREPYFFADKKKVNYWKYKINSNKLLIGINWQGNKDLENEDMKGRSFDLNYFEKISNLSHIQLLSLQNGYGREQLKTCRFKDKIIDFGDNLSLDDVSAIIMNCDIIITPCTMISHLSGALGKETWTLIEKMPYWFWGLNTEKNIWYSSVRLFRQIENKNWHDVFERIKNTLANTQNLNYFKF